MKLLTPSSLILVFLRLRDFVAACEFGLALQLVGFGPQERV
jgi:hypothetical protein